MRYVAKDFDYVVWDSFPGGGGSGSDVERMPRVQIFQIWIKFGEGVGKTRSVWLLSCLCDDLEGKRGKVARVQIETYGFIRTVVRIESEEVDGLW